MLDSDEHVGISVIYPDKNLIRITYVGSSRLRPVMWITNAIHTSDRIELDYFVLRALLGRSVLKSAVL